MKDYYLGFDIGTNSVGWAVTDEHYELYRFRGKDMWGIHLFDEAETAADRRMKRTNRRRLQRRNRRLKLLQELFAEEISKVDPEFFIRLNESKLFLEDKTVSVKHPLFPGPDYTDIQFHEEYPTIYHLRSDLVHSKEEHDIRMVYLAIHHILKNRGHFLVAGDLQNATDFETTLRQFIDAFNENMTFNIIVEDTSIIESALRDKRRAKSVLAKEITGAFSFDSELDKESQKKCENAIKTVAAMMVGNQGDLRKLFWDREIEAEDRLVKVKFSESKYDEEIEPELESALPEEMFVVSSIKALYDWSLLVDILSGKEFFSDAKIESYNTHKNNLMLLHALMKKYCDKSTYKEFFDGTDPKKATYSNYVGQIKNGKRNCSEEDFYKTLAKELEKIKESIEDADKGIYEMLYEGALLKTLLPLQRSKDNSVVPRQVHEKELNAILKNAERYLPFLKEKDNEGRTVSEKVMSIFRFRVPYYVGPLSTRHKEDGSNAWIVRKKDGCIYPWNFDDMVDKSASNERFIRRMTNKCTYLIGEDVLPKQSLLYSRFMVLNELNNLRIRGQKVSTDLKQQIYKDLFMNNQKVTGKRLLKYLQGDDSELVLEDLSGFDIDFKASLSSYIQFRDNVFGDRIEEDSIREMTENIIKWATIYGDDKKMLEEMITNVYPGVLDEKQMATVKRMHFSGWGNFSEKFLSGIEGTNSEDGVVATIIDALWDTNHNLMQLLSGQFTYTKTIKEINREQTGDIKEVSYEELVKDMYTSPANKRAIWRTVLIAEEVKKVMGCPPKKIFVEMARGGEKQKTRKASRKQRLLDLYAACKEDARDWISEIDAREEREFNSMKLYLYYTQMGKCAYTGKDIDLDELMQGNSKWDRDHIYPQSRIKDDSIDNLVLVQKVENAKKDNGMISRDIQKKMINIWRMWLDNGLISKSKFDRLIRRDDFTPEELAGFVSRQLVETRQSTKLVAELFERLYPTSRIVRVKAGLVSDFRKMPLNVLKSRRVNDYHHAVDAYLNIVVGNVYSTRFTMNPIEWVKKNRDENWSINKVFFFDVDGAWKSPDKEKGVDGKYHSIKNDRGEIVTGTIDTIRRNAKKNSVMYTEYVYCDSGQLFDETLQTAEKKTSIPLKKGLSTEKYGGYTSPNTSYFAMIEFDGKKGERVRQIIGVPIYVANMLGHDSNAFKKYCEETKGLKNVDVLREKIKKNALMIVNGFPMRIRGENEKNIQFKSNMQLHLEGKDSETVRNIEKWLEKNSEYRIVKEFDGLDDERMISLFKTFIAKLSTSYERRPSNQLKTLVENEKAFEQLSTEEKAIVLNQIIMMFRCDNETKANLKLINGSSNAGSMAVNKNTVVKGSPVLVNQSVTGLFENRIEL